MNMRRVFNFLNKRQAHRAERLLPRAATFFFLLFFSFSKGSKEAACQLTTDRHNSHAITFDLRPSVHSFKKETAKLIAVSKHNPESEESKYLIEEEKELQCEIQRFISEFRKIEESNEEKFNL